MGAGMTQFTIGFLLGLLLGLGLRQLRPLVLLAAILVVMGALYIVYQTGIPGLALLLERLANETRLYSAFFAALAVGKLVGGALARVR